MISRSAWPAHCQAALAHFTAGDFAAAMEDLRWRLTADDDGRIWELLGVIAHANGDRALAESALEEASIRVPLSARGQLALAGCYQLAGYREASAAVYRHLALQEGLDVELLEPLASGLGRCGEYERALNVCRLAARRMPDSAQPWVGIVHYMRRLRWPIEKILPAMFRAHHLEPENAEYRVTLAWMLYESGRSTEAAHLLEPVAHDKCSCIRCLTLMQHIFESVGDEEQSTVCRTRLMALASQRASGTNEPTEFE